MSVIILLSTILIILTIVFFYKHKYEYWKKRNLPYLEPRFPFGNIPNPFSLKQKPGQIINQMYKEMKRNRLKHAGIYFLTKPIYFILDLDYIKNILTKDFGHFTDRGFFYNDRDDPLGASLFFLGEPKWKHIRVRINPSLTSSRMKMMFPLIINCAENLLKEIKSKINLNDLLSSFTIDVIGSCAFGIDCNSSKNDKFKYYGKKSLEISKFKLVTQMLAAVFPKLAKVFRIKTVPTDVSDFFLKIVEETVRYRRENNYERHDFVQLMMESDCGSIEEIAAQCFMFFVAGFETSASTMTFAMYELAKNEDIQDKVRREIGDVLCQNGGKLDYELVKNMVFLQQVLDEKMRKYPILLYLTRKCVQDYKVPDEDVIIEKDTLVIIPTQAIHYDEEYYPDPETFDPERFNYSQKESRHRYAHLAFGEGPRICIGKRFGMLQSKLCLIYLLKNYKFQVNETTKEPLTFKTASLVVTPDEDIYLDVQQIF